MMVYANQQNYRRLHRVFVCLLVFQIACLFKPVWSHAEESPTLLTLDSTLLGASVSLQGDETSAQIQQLYYDLLAPELYQQIMVFRERLIALVPDYVVAFTAADSAEVTQVKSYINTVWAEIRTLHAQNFMPDAAHVLDTSYNNIFAILDSEAPAEMLGDLQ